MFRHASVIVSAALSPCQQRAHLFLLVPAGCLVDDVGWVYIDLCRRGIAGVSDTIAILRLSGVLDRLTVPEAHAQVVTTLKAGDHTLILDLQNVPSIDGAGATTVLFGLHRACQDGGEGPQVIHPQEGTVDLLAVAHRHFCRNIWRWSNCSIHRRSGGNFRDST